MFVFKTKGNARDRGFQQGKAIKDYSSRWLVKLQEDLLQHAGAQSLQDALKKQEARLDQICQQWRDADYDTLEEAKGIAAGLGDVWLEKVKFRTNRKTSLEEIVGEDTPLSGLLQAVESLEFRGDALKMLVPDLANLKSKLPAELLDEDSLLESQPEHLNELREEVKELLIAKLIQHGGEA